MDIHLVVKLRRRPRIQTLVRGGYRTAATSKMERFVIIVNGFQPLTIITKRSIKDVAAVLDPPLLVLVVTLLKRYQNYVTISLETFMTYRIKLSVIKTLSKNFRKKTLS